MLVVFLHKDAEKKVEEERIRTENILKGNPLLNQQEKVVTDFKVKRRSVIIYQTISGQNTVYQTIDDQQPS